jgi:tripartite-type tricarboxylate transporter receptor subunit TctC
MHRILLAVAVGLLTILPAASHASDSFPGQTVHIIVPLSAGSVTDILARTIADKLTEIWHQPVIVENRPGIAGTGSAAKGPADGHTLLLTSNGHAAITSFNKNLSFDPVKDFAGVTQVATVPFVLVASKNVPIANLRELIDLARAKPGALNIAAPGLGTSANIAGELFKQEAKIDLLTIPYKGSPEAHISVLRGDTDLMFSAVNIGIGLIRDGKVRPLAIATEARLPALPDIPTFAEAGLPNFKYDAWFGIMVPAGVPREIVDRLNRDIGAVLQLPEVRQALEREGVEPRIGSPDQFDAIIKADTERYTGLFKDAGIGAN